MDPAPWAAIMKTQGPWATVTILLIIVCIALVTALLAYVRETQKTMVPMTVLNDYKAAADRLCAQQHCDLAATVEGIHADVKTLLDRGRR